MPKPLPARFETVTSENVNITDKYRDAAKGYTGEEGAVYVTNELDTLAKSIIERHDLKWISFAGMGEFETLGDRAERAVQGAVQKCDRDDCDLEINLVDIAKGDADRLELACSPRTFDTESAACEFEEVCAAARQATFDALPDFLQGVNAAVLAHKATIEAANSEISTANSQLDQLI